jgi:hypothetical protein
MEIRRVDKKDVVENLELIYKDKNFSIPTTTTKGAFFMGGKKIKEEDIKYANYKGAEYIQDKEGKELFINNKTHITEKIKNVEIYQANDQKYNLVVIRCGEVSEDGLVFDENRDIVVQIMNYRKDKNRLIGMKVEKDKIKLFAESTSGLGDKYYYELKFPTKKEGPQPHYYNLSAL